MPRVDLDNEPETIANHRRRIRNPSRSANTRWAQEEEHAVDLATALGSDAPPIAQL